MDRQPRFAVALILGTVVFCVSGYSYNSHMLAQTIRFPFPTSGRYRIHGEAPKGFGTIYEFEWKLREREDVSALRVNKEGKIPIDGEILVTPAEFRPGTTTVRHEEMNTSGQSHSVEMVKLKFVAATLQLRQGRLDKISFKTSAVDGTSYVFDGKFLAKPRLEGGSYVELAGNMRKLKDGKQQAQAETKFLRWAYE